METIILDLLNYWFDNPEVWFECSSNTDIIISEKYGYLLDQLFEPSDTYDTKYNLGLIILWDQISRHVYRDNPSKIIPYHQKSLDLSLDMLDKNQDKGLKPKERCFLLMPLRHTFDRSYLEMVIEIVKGYMKDDGFDPYRRFYRATLLSYSKLITTNIIPESVNLTISTDHIYPILDKKSYSTTSVVSYPAVSDKKVYKSKIYKQFDSFIRIQKPEGITVSISGGVDSMVCSYVLYHIRKRYPNLHIVAVMVNYNNRENCNVETQLVTRWLKSLDIPLYIRHIKYLRRKSDTDPTDRNFYEKVTKQFRFDLYRRFGYPVILGHNKDDSIENIFTNIRKGRNYDNLRGMSPITSIDDIVFYRPLLDIIKEQIYGFANSYNIPFLVDSTPSWSDRGKMRDILIPFLNSFDPALVPGLVRLAESITQISQAQTILLDRFKENITFDRTEDIATIELSEESPERSLGFEFWKQVVKYICSNLEVSMCSNKSIYVLIKSIESGKCKKINLSKRLEVVHKINSVVFRVK